jgi:hypothetical protein
MKSIIIIISILTLIYVCNNYNVVKKIENYVNALPSTWKPKDIGASCECFLEDMDQSWKYTYKMGDYGKCSYGKGDNKMCENVTKEDCVKRYGVWDNTKHCEGKYNNMEITGVIDNAPWTEQGKKACKPNTKRCVSGDDMYKTVEKCQTNAKGEKENCETYKESKLCQKDNDCGQVFHGQYWRDRMIASGSGIANRGHRAGKSLRDTKFG